MLNLKEQRLMTRYKDALQMPKWKYIFLYGVVGWGVIVAILVVLLEAIIEWNPPTWNAILQTFLLYPLGGIFMGMFMRWMVKKQLNKLQQKQNTE